MAMDFGPSRPPPAALMPRGTVVLSLSGTESSDLTDSVVLYGMGIFALGLVTGWLLFRP